MLRPNDFLAWYRLRAQAGQSDLTQVIDGLQVGGMVVVGGSEGNAHRVLPVMRQLNRIGAVVPLTHAILDPDRPATFDTAAIAQLLMMVRSEVFHEVSEATLGLVETLLADGHEPEVALQLIRERVAQVAKL